MNKLYAVYGTLKKNHGNHKLIENNSKFVGEQRLKGFKMFNTGYGYPAIVEDADSEITVELYEVPKKETQRNLDALEGYYPDMEDVSLYLRRTVPVEVDGKQTESYIYIWNRSTNNFTEIENGCY